MCCIRKRGLSKIAPMLGRFIGVVALCLLCGPGAHADYSPVEESAPLLQVHFDRLIPTTQPLLIVQFDRLIPRSEPVIDPGVPQVPITEHLVHSMDSPLLITIPID